MKINLCIFSLLVLIHLSASRAPGQVIINEFLASNNSVNADIIDYGDFSDWIELYNPNSHQVDLSGYFITDNLNIPLKWQFPDSTSIPPGSYLLLWADGFDDVPGTVNTRTYWPFDEFVTQGYHTNFKLSALGEEIGLFRTDGNRSTTLIEAGSEWKYLDDGSDQDTLWRLPEYDDSWWSSGQAELGYGDGDERTVIGYGPDPLNKNATTYFRKTFDAFYDATCPNLIIRMKMDDGAIIYLNGTEVLRPNMPDGYIPYNGYSFGSVWGDEEFIFFEWTVPGNDLVDGSNVIAVEIHQNLPDGGDLSFDLELTGIDYSTIELVDSISFNLQKDDVSLGRLPDSPTEWRHFAEPTPEGSNNTDPTLDLLPAGQVIFSLEPGFYNGDQVLELSTFSPSTTIRYTTNGSIPDNRSTEYSLPLLIDKSVVIKARAFETGRAPGIIVTRTYLINEADFTLPVISFSADSLALWDEEKGIYLNEIKQREIPVSLEYFNERGLMKFSINAGFRLGGLNIWRFAQKPLTIYIRGKYGDDALYYQLFTDKPVGVLNRFVFRNGGDDHPLCMLRDPMTWSLLQGQTGCGVQAYRPCVLFLNGEYWGLYNLRERYDDQFFVSNFCADPSTIDHIEITKTVVGNLQLTITGNPADYNALENFVRYWDPTDEADYDSVCAMMDVDSFIDFLTAEIFTANRSWPHNREWWRSDATDGKWTWLITDLDRGYDLNRLSSRLALTLYEGYPLFNRLLQADSFRNRFVQRLAAHLNSTFAPDRFEQILDSLSSRILPEMPRHIARWRDDDGIQSVESWQANLEVMKLFTRQRADTVFQNIDSLLALDGIVNLSVHFDPPGGGKLIIDDVPILSMEDTGRYFKGIPFTVTALANSGFRFDGWDGISNSNTIDLTLTGDSTIYGSFVISDSYLLPSEFTFDTTLTVENSPYAASGDITVQAGAVLTIEEGVEIRLPRNTSIYIHGGLKVQGSRENPVRFNPDRDTGTEEWGALCFVNSTDQSILSHVEIRGATSGSDPINLKAAVSAYNSDIRIENALLEEVGFPIFTQYSDVVLRNSVIRTDVTCDYINVKFGYGLVENCVFLGNQSRDTDAIDYDRVDNGIISGNKIYNFSGFNSDGVDIGEESRNISIYGNIFYNCFDKGISIGQKSTVVIERNLFIGCNQGVAVKDSSEALANQNTFFSNFQSVACYEKIAGAGGARAEIVNCIMAASSGQPVYVDSLSSMIISYSISDTDELPGEGNINEDPLFVNRQMLNLSLLPHSPCIDAGDPSQRLDPDGSICDMGAYYHYDPDDFPVDHNEYDRMVVINEINYNSLPGFNPEDWVELYNPGDSDTDLSGWSLRDDNDMHRYAFPDSTILRPGGFLVLCLSLELFKGKYPSLENVIGGFEFGLDADGDAVRLFDRNGILVSWVAFDNEPPWTNGANGNGRTLELVDPLSDVQLPENWLPSLTKTGTPGFANSVYSALNGIPPTEYNLSQNYPNPFNSTTRIKFDLVEPQLVKLTVFDLQGRLVRLLIDERMSIGTHVYRFNGKELGSGLYFYRLDTETYTNTRKMVLLK